MIQQPRGVTAFVMYFLLCACAASTVRPGQERDFLTLEPEGAKLAVVNGVEAEQPYRVILHKPSGATFDVTPQTRFVSDAPNIGWFRASTFWAQGRAAGIAPIKAYYLDNSVEGEIHVVVKRSRIADSAPSNSEDLFDAAKSDSQHAPIIRYPMSGTLFPLNVGDFEAHWSGATGATLAEVRLASANVDVRVYTQCATPDCWIQFLPKEWSVAALSEPGGQLLLTVRTLNPAQPGKAGLSEMLIAITNEEIAGAIYYWATAGSDEGFYRHDMSQPQEPAEQFYTTAQSPAGRCVGCHTLSRDGSKMAFTYDGGDGKANILDIAGRSETLARDAFAWNFATFDPTGDRLLTSRQGTLTLRDGKTATELSTVPTNGYATQPDFSPTGDAIVYVAPTNTGTDWNFGGGRIVIQPFDSQAGTFGTPRTIVQGGNNYYPSWSPDGRWILYNSAPSGPSYNNANASLFIIRADGSAPATELTLINLQKGLTNSWARWAPFAQQFKGTASGSIEEALYWISFSSKRPFGVRMTDSNVHPQIWMAPFFPDRLTAGKEPSAAAFRLPFQDLRSSNHIAQWTERISEE